MRLFLPPLEIGETEGFVAAKDIFGRAKLGQGLSNVLASVSDPLVVAVDGQWGSGKTAFLKMWAGSLRKEGYPVVYFDAFENDFADDAFLALAGQIIALLEQAKKSSSGKAKIFVKQAKAAGKILLRSSLRLGVKIATLNALDTKELEDSASAVAEELSELADRHIGERLTRHRADVATFEAFRCALSDLPGLLGSSDSSKPLVLIVDELDRCKPIYALELLERIKHFFTVTNIHFALGVNLPQLENSVLAAYGANIDSRMYLQKFIQLVVPIVDDAEHAHERVARKYIDHLLKQFDFSEADKEAARDVSGALLRIANARGLSLRSIERAMGYIALSLAFTGSGTWRPATLMAGLAVIKAIDPVLYRKAKDGTISYSEVEAVLSLPPLHEDETQNDSDVNWWRLCLDRNASLDFKARMMQSLARYNLWRDSENLIHILANGVMDRFAYPQP